MGGLSKKSFQINELRNDPSRPALVVTGGNLLFAADRFEPDDAARATITAEGVLQASQLMGADFAAVGSRDLAAGVPFLQKSHKPPAFTWLSLNLVDGTSRTPPFTPVLHRRVGDITLAILALTDHTAFPAEAGGFLVEDWRISLPKVLASIGKDTDLVVLLSNYPLAENQEIARKHNTIDLILQTGHAIGNMNPIPIGNTLIGQAEIRGKYLGVLDIDRNRRGPWVERAHTPPDAEKRPPAAIYSNRFIALKVSLPEDPEVAAMVKQTQRRLDKLQHGRQP